MNNLITVYTDGSMQRNPGFGGWSAVVIIDGDSFYLRGWESSTTINRMEMQAAIAALRVFEKPTQVRIHSDSKILVDGANLIKKHFQTTGGWLGNRSAFPWKPNKPNLDLWREIEQLSRTHLTNWVWVRAHNGNHYNEIADKQAKMAVREGLVAWRATAA